MRLREFLSNRGVRMTVIEAAKRYVEECERYNFGFKESEYQYVFDRERGCWVWCLAEKKIYKE